MGEQLLIGGLTVDADRSGWYVADSPFGGYNQSDIGRQRGLEGFEQYLETKIIAMPPA